jgi:hypothetical protein
MYGILRTITYLKKQKNEELNMRLQAHHGINFGRLVAWVDSIHVQLGCIQWKKTYQLWTGV